MELLRSAIIKKVAIIFIATLSSCSNRIMPSNIEVFKEQEIHKSERIKKDKETLRAFLIFAGVSFLIINVILNDSNKTKI
jgi:hypothetical protein